MWPYRLSLMTVRITTTVSVNSLLTCEALHALVFSKLDYCNSVLASLWYSTQPLNSCTCIPGHAKWIQPEICNQIKPTPTPRGRGLSTPNFFIPGISTLCELHQLWILDWTHLVSWSPVAAYMAVNNLALLRPLSHSQSISQPRSSPERTIRWRLVKLM